MSVGGDDGVDGVPPPEMEEVARGTSFDGIGKE